MLDRVLPLERHNFTAPNGRVFTTDGVIPGRRPEGVNFYDVDYFNGGRADKGIQFPRNGSYLDPHSEYEAKFSAILAWINSYIPDGDVLDVGTGPGHLAYWADQLGLPFNVFGCDISHDLLTSRYNLNPKATVVAELHKIPYGSDNFNAVVFSDVLEHVHPNQAVEAVTEGSRVLVPGGHIFMRIPNRDTWTDAAYRDQAHVWLPTPDEVRSLLEISGFEPDSISVFTRGFPDSQKFIEEHGYDHIQPQYGAAICATAMKPLE